MPDRPATAASPAPSGLTILAALAVVAALLGTVPGPAGAVPGAGQAVFVNELHYDNDGTDIGEFVEIAGPAGTDLTGWSIALYNGSATQLNVYGTIALAGVIDDEGGGSGAVSFAPPASIQNGAPDGLALVDPGGAVRQFLSYEGTFTAGSGPAAGQTSTDIGVAESGATPAGQSLQLTGAGALAGDFAWTGPSAESPGSLNAGQTLGGAPGDRVVISEIMQNPAAVADSAGEWFEVHNPGATTVDLDGWTISDDGTDSHTISGPVEVPAGGFAVLGNNADQATNGGVAVDYEYSSVFLANGDDEVVLTDPDDAEVDRVAYDGGPAFPDPTGASMGLGDLAADNAVGANWCTSTTPIGAGPDLGTPGAANDPCDGGPGGLTLISAIQGSVPAPDPDASTAFPADGDPADNSPLNGQAVTIEGIVVGWDDLAGQSNAGNIFHNDRGIFVQEEEADWDGDPTTSEGIFVQFSSAADAVADYQLGDRVQVAGTVTEHFELTVIDDGSTITIVDGGNPLPPPVDIDPATIDRDGWEAVEGQRVRLPEGVANSGGTNRFGELILTPGPVRDLLVRPGTSAGIVALVGESGAGNPAVPRKPEVPSPTTVRADLFDTVQDAIGPVSYSFDLYKIFVQADALPTVVDTGVAYPFDGIGPAGADQVRVTALNVENFFGVGVVHDGSPVDQQEYENKRDRIVDAVDRLLQRPDIVGVEEVDDLPILADVAANLGGYTAHLIEGNDNRGIDVGFLTRDSVTVRALTQLGATAPDPTGDGCGDIAGLLFDRPPLQLDVTVAGIDFSVINNHWSSKAAPDSCRDAQATFVRDQVAALEAAGVDVIVTGDLNAFEDETPLAILEDGTTTLDNLWDAVPIDPVFGGAYSFQFTGVLQTLDHLLVTEGFDAYDPQLTYAHFDTAYYDRELDEPTLTGPFGDGHKVSDHDPPVLTLTVDVGPRCAGLDATIVGTDAGEVIVGTDGDDVILALGGDDTIDGRGGDDVICAGDGDDRVTGGAGHDLVLGEAGLDRLEGNSGDDTVDGGPDDDVLLGHAGDDTLDGGAGDDTLVGGSGADDLDAGDGDDRARGNAGPDTIAGGPGDDDLTGNSGDDQLSGGDGDDRLTGGSGADDLQGGGDDDVLTGGSAGDDLDGGPGIDVLNGSGGIDTCVNGEEVRSCEE